MSNFHPFRDMAESAKAQHEVDKAKFKAAKTQAKASWEDAKLSPKDRQILMQKKRDEQIEEAKAKTAEAQMRIDFAKKQKE